MSLLTDILTNSLNPENISTLASRLGIENAQAKKAISEALPALLDGLKKSASSDSGAKSLDAALAKDHDGSVLSDIVNTLSDGSGKKGDKIVGHILGENTQNAVQSIAEKAGIDQHIAKTLLEGLGPIVMGALGKAKKENNLSIESVRGLFSGDTSGFMKTLGGMFDQDGDGDFDLSDAFKIGVSLLQKKR